MGPRTRQLPAWRPAKSLRVGRVQGVCRSPGRWRRPPRRRSGWNWTAIAAVIAALAAAAGVYFTGQSLDAARVQNETVEQAQLTDRFTKAVDQLDRAGTDHLQARLGGIYALERLGKDSRRDRPTIVEILAAFVRTTTPQPFPYDTAAIGYEVCTQEGVQPDVQAALTVLGRLNTGPSTRINLPNTCLLRADLSGLDFKTANFAGSFLGEANLVHADLSGANLTGVNFEDADIRDASFRDAELPGSHFSDFRVTGDAERAHGLDFGGVDLRGANLLFADLLGSDLTHALYDENTEIDTTLTNENTRGKWW